MTSKKRTVEIGGQLREIPVEEGMTYEQVLAQCDAVESGIVTVAKADHLLVELDWEIPNEVERITFLDTSFSDGRRVYMRSLSFVFVVAVSRCFPQYTVYVEHSISGGLYCTLRNGEEIVAPDSKMKNIIREEMQRLIGEDIPLRREEWSVERAVQLFREKEEYQKANLLQYRKDDTIGIYNLEDSRDHFFGYLVPRTGVLQTFDLELF